jgi:hypothetical protein
MNHRDSTVAGIQWGHAPRDGRAHHLKDAMTMRSASTRTRRAFGGLLVTLAAAVAGACGTAAASPILNLVTTGSLTMTQGTTGTLAISVTNTGASAINLASLSIGLQLISDGVTTGDLTLDDFLGTGTAWTNPATLPPFGETLQLGDLNGTPSFFQMSITGEYELLPSVTAVLGTVELAASGDALGTWKIWAVNEWIDGFFPGTVVDDDQFNQQQFTNLLATEGSPGVTLQIGSIVVTPVPEPSSLAILGAAAAVLGGVRVVRARARARVVRSTDA